MKKLASATDPLWYKDAVIYEIHVRAFADSNGDGIGDFPGLISRLDYLQELGVTCLWLLPFFPSPLRDDGYDIANYVDVNPSYGTLNDFKLFLDAAHQRNMQVMIELVINHTSDQHPWFKAARLAPKGSPEREMYVWSDTDQLYKDARIIFTDTEKSNWTWDDTAKAFYWHRFFSHQPDLNFDNPRVMEEVLRAMRFWFDMGVDALRLDAIPYLVERDGSNCENLPETHDVIKAIRAAIDAEYANRLVLAEANQWPADVRPYFGDGDECHMAFHFPLMPRIYMALRQEDRLPITDIMAQTPDIPANCQWGLFLRNHDELTLEMVTDDERDYMYLAYSADPRMRINVGIRRRLAPLLDNNRRRIELLNSLLLSFPGTPILYYGDEIGMGDNIYLGDRNGVRTPMQWTSDRNAGFSRCDPARLYFPVVMDPIYGYQVVNVEAQLSDQSSLLHWTRNMIALRKLFQVFGRGTLKFYNPANRKVLAYLRDLDRGDGTHETVLCLANLSRFAQPVSLDLAEHAGLQPVEMLGYVQFPIITQDPYPLTLAPYSFLWLELQPVSEIEELPDFAELPEAEARPITLTAASWQELLTGAGATTLGAALTAWLPKQRFFGAKSRTIQSIEIKNWVELVIDGNLHLDSPIAARTARSAHLPPALVFVDITYTNGSIDTYQVPLAITTGPDAEEIAATHPEIVLTTLNASGPFTLVHDAAWREETRQLLLALIEGNATLPMKSPPQVATADAALDTLAIAAEQKIPDDTEATPNTVDRPSSTAPVAPQPLTAQPGEAATAPRSSAPAQPFLSSQQLQPRESPTAGDPIPQSGRLDARASSTLASILHSEHPVARVGSAEQSNTSILYGNKLILKLFRRLQPGENPDVEIGRFLTETAKFAHIAPFLGEISITPQSSNQTPGEKTTIAMLQGLVANQGDGWQWFLDQLQKFLASVVSFPAPPPSPTPSLASANTHHELIRQHAHAALEAAGVLGQRTAQMHLALATPTEDPAFAAEPLTQEDLTSDARRIERQLHATIETLRIKLSSIQDEQISDAAALLLSKRSTWLARARSIQSLMPEGKRIRIHGDYHLGQTLRVESNAKGDPSSSTKGDFVLLDFEGEPARPLSERRQKQSPLKDVAGMVRSFSYAAYAGLFRFLEINPAATDQNNTTAWVQLWQNALSAEFLHAYRQSIAANPGLLPSAAEAQSLLDAYLLEKALYELLYELNNRVTWLRIPLAGILAL
ncbi:MAG TPA: maltose alpha-D-glucosyltransferase [Acidobacteriaceae bacterium]